MHNTIACCSDQNVYQGTETILEFIQRTAADKKNDKIVLQNYSQKSITCRTSDTESTSSMTPRLAHLANLAPGSLKLDGYLIEGYKHNNAYLYTKEPTGESIINFWRLVWQENVCVVVAIDLTGTQLESMYNYLPTKSTKIKSVDHFKITLLHQNDTHPLFAKKIILKNIKINGSNNLNKRVIFHCIFKWPNDAGSRIPKLGTLIAYMNKLQQKSIRKAKQWTGCASGPPILIHSITPEISSELITIDISIKQLSVSRKMDVDNNAKLVAQQLPMSTKRAGCDKRIAFVVVELARHCNLVTAFDVGVTFGHTSNKREDSKEKEENAIDDFDDTTLGTMLIN